MCLGAQASVRPLHTVPDDCLLACLFVCSGSWKLQYDVGLIVWRVFLVSTKERIATAHTPPPQIERKIFNGFLNNRFNIQVHAGNNSRCFSPSTM